MMDTIIRNVRDINSSERRVLEQVLGQKLRENQQVIVQIVTLTNDAERNQPESVPTDQLPDWCHVYAGLSDDQVAEVEGAILQRADLSRNFE